MFQLLVSHIANEDPRESLTWPRDLNVQVYGVSARFDGCNGILELKELPLLYDGYKTSINVDVRLVKGLPTYLDYAILFVRGRWTDQGKVEAFTVSQISEPRAFSDPRFLEILVERAQLALYLTKTQ
jgi:hypothetical protein